MEEMNDLPQNGSTGKELQNYDGAVQVIKRAILQQQLHAARQVNAVQLALYYSVGRFVSTNSRLGYWKKGAIDYISKRLQEQLPGLRGFSATNLKLMRLFYEAWECLNTGNLEGMQLIDGKPVIKSSVATDEIGE